ncbi:MAG: hypothetical protein ACRD5W_16010, partial [Candidatus Acidiferrales bacterium]
GKHQRHAQQSAECNQRPPDAPFHVASAKNPRKGRQQDQRVADYGEADAYGHKKKVDIGHALAAEVSRRTGEDTMVSDLTYDLRSGEPDAVDTLVGNTFANIALDLLAGNTTGRMTAIRDGRYAHSPLPDPSLGPRKVDVSSLYNTERYRPNYASKLGAPLLLDAI